MPKRVVLDYAGLTKFLDIESNAFDIHVPHTIGNRNSGTAFDLIDVAVFERSFPEYECPCCKTKFPIYKFSKYSIE
jgi:hypothetical protein